MEPRGCNRWQPVANGIGADAPEQAKTVAVGCDRLPHGSHGKEGSTVRVRERALQEPRTMGFCFGLSCRLSNVMQVWSPFVEPSGLKCPRVPCW
jgi:hypothetical protein